MIGKRSQVLLILGLVLLARIPDLPYHYMDWDEAAMMSQAWAMTQGQSLYKDIYQIHPVLNFAVFYPFFLLFPTDLAPHLIKALNLALIAFGALRVRRICLKWLADQECALMAALVFVFYFSFRWAQSSYGEFYALFPLILAVECLFFSPGAGTGSWFLFGLLGAVAILLKQMAAFDVLGLGLTALLWRGAGRKRDAAPSLGMFLIGAAAVFLPVGAWLAAKGVLMDSFRAMVIRPLTGYTQLIPTETTSLGGMMLRRLSVLGQMVRGVGVPFCVPVLLTIAGTVVARPAWRDRVGGAAPEAVGIAAERFRRAGFGVFLIWLAVGLLGMVCIGRYFPHYQVQLIPALALLSAYFPATLSKKARTTLAVGALVVTYLAVGTVFLQRLTKTGWTPNRVRRSTRIAAYLRENTEAQDRIFLYRVDNLDVFYLAERLSNNGIYMFIDMFEQHSGDVRAAAERRDDFRRSLPRALLVDPTGPLLGCTDSVAFFRRIIEADYVRRSSIDGVEIYFRRAPPG